MSLRSATKKIPACSSTSSAELTAALLILAPQLQEEVNAIRSGWKVHPSDRERFDNNREQHKRQHGSPQAVIADGSPNCCDIVLMQAAPCGGGIAD